MALLAIRSVYIGALGALCAPVPCAAQALTLGQLMEPVLKKDCPAKSGAPFGTSNCTRDHVDPAFVVPSNTDDPPLVTSWGEVPMV